MTDRSYADRCHLEMKLKQDVESPARHAPKPRMAGGEEAEVAPCFRGPHSEEFQRFNLAQCAHTSHKEMQIMIRLTSPISQAPRLRLRPKREMGWQLDGYIP